jgi:hypothetical protein
MLTLQTARHAVDYTFTAVKQLRESEVVTAPLDDPRHPPAPAERRRTGSSPAVVWLKKIAHLGIGERWLVLSVLAAAGQPVLALGVLLVLGLMSLAYTSLGRTLRARRWTPTVVADREREVVAAQVDGGPLHAVVAGSVAGRPGGQERFLWARPAALRVLEYAGTLGLSAALAGAAPGAAVFALLLVVASHHYDDLYRVLNRLRPPAPASQLLGLGWPGRLAVVAVLALVGGRAGVAGLWVLVGVLGVLFLVVEPWRVLREVRGGVPHDGAVLEATADG